MVERYHADRVVIASQHADDEGLLELVRAFKSIGVPVSLLPRPLDLLEAPAATPSQVGGVPLIEVEALAARGAVPYTGPDRRAQPQDPDQRRRAGDERGVGTSATCSQRLPEGLHEVILVDGNSKDDTIEAARRAYPSIRVLTQSGRGKGDAFRTGFAAVTGNLVVMLDADGSADPAEIPRFVDALEAGADFAKGSRFLDGGGSADITGLRRLGNTFLSGTANLLHGTHFTDLCYGYNAFWARCLPFIALDVPGFEVETLINLRIAGAGMKITEVPSYEADRISRREQPQHLPRRLPRARHDPQRGAAPPQHPPRAASRSRPRDAGGQGGDLHRLSRRSATRPQAGPTPPPTPIRARHADNPARRRRGARRGATDARPQKRP